MGGTFRQQRRFVHLLLLWVIAVLPPKLKCRAIVICQSFGTLVKVLGVEVWADGSAQAETRQRAGGGSADAGDAWLGALDVQVPRHYRQRATVSCRAEKSIFLASAIQVVTNSVGLQHPVHKEAAGPSMCDASYFAIQHMHPGTSWHIIS